MILYIFTQRIFQNKTKQNKKRLKLLNRRLYFTYEYILNHLYTHISIFCYKLVTKDEGKSSHFPNEKIYNIKNINIKTKKKQKKPEHKAIK